MKIAKSNEMLESFLAKSDNRQIYEQAKSQITLVDISRDCPKWEEEKYVFCEKELKDAFTNRSFTSIIEKSWNKWVNTLGRI